MAVKKRRRAVTSPIERANKKADEDFVADYLKPGAPKTQPWTTQWTHPRTGATYSISLARSAHVGELALETCFRLIEETSRADYDASVQKWREGDKRKEMREADLRYIIVRREGGIEEENKGEEMEANGNKDIGNEKIEEEGDKTDGTDTNGQDDKDSKTDKSIRGFTSLMPTYEEGQPVVYCYEIHLKPELRGTGLSELLFGFLSTVAYNLPPISKVMLTCFLSNARALRFYQKQGFERDDVSPETRRLRGGKTVVPDYMILSKTVSR